VSFILEIAKLAEAQNLPFLLIGGHAVILHGFPRNTFDLDLLILRQDRCKWIDLLKRLGQEKVSDGLTFLQFESAAKTMMPVDLMLSNPATFEKMSAESLVALKNFGTIRMVSLRHLVALKCHAIKFGHPGRVEKDVDDLIGLGKANNLNWNDAEWHGIVLKHGTKELDEKLQRSR
jgi:hypothetical protein